MKIGVYGGTFNPIHNGHVHILREFIAAAQLDVIYIIPTANPPHKPSFKLAGATDRIEMCKLAVEDIDAAEVIISNIEIERKGKSFTADTLRVLHEIHPFDELFLLVGEDMFLTLDKWYMPEVIFDMATICAAPRSNSPELISFADELKKVYGTSTIIMDIDYLPISSTQIREFVATGQSIYNLVPKKVAEYIEENHVYDEYEE